tara:strand:+ start:5446 stop:6261 length:816 start_codon:yes stop_codon:yes gene_type:complete
MSYTFTPNSLSGVITGLKRTETLGSIPGVLAHTAPSAIANPMMDAATAGAVASTGGGFLSKMLPGLMASGGNPYVTAASVAIPFVVDLFQKKQQQEKLESLMKEQRGMIRALEPQLKAQAAGQESAASRAIMQQVEKRANMSRQAAAASATRSGQMGTSVGRAQQERIGYERDANLTQLLGQQQQQATQQYQSLINQLGSTLNLQAMQAQQEQMKQTQLATSLASLFKTPDSELSETNKQFKTTLEKMARQMNMNSETFSRILSSLDMGVQ